MNKIFKLIWSNALNGWVVCSELGKKTKKSSAKTLLIGAIALTSSYSAYAVECTSGGGAIKYFLVNQQNNPCDISKTEDSFTDTYLLLRRGNVTFTKDITLTGSGSSSMGGIIAQYSPSTITGKNLTMTIGTSGFRGNVVGVNSSSGNTIKFDNVIINAKPGLVASYSYGLLAGSSTDAGDSTSAKTYSDIIVKDVNITMSSTLGQSAALRAIQGGHDSNITNGNGSVGRIIVNGNLTAAVTGSNSNGIYVSGSSQEKEKIKFDDNDTEREVSVAMTEVVLNGAENLITTVRSTDGNGVKLGKSNDTAGQGGGRLTLNGALTIDTTQSNGAAIRLLNNSFFDSRNENSSLNVIAKGSAILISDSDTGTGTNNGDTSSEEAKIYLNKANLKSTSTNSSLILINPKQKNVDLRVKNDSALTASSAGWLIEVQGDSTVSSEFSKGVNLQGLVKTSSSGELKIKLNDQSIWQLTKNGIKTESTFTELTLNNSILNGFDVEEANWGTSDFTLNGKKVNSKGGVISLANGKAGDLLTLEANYKGSDNAIVKMNTLWNAPGTEDGTNSISDVLRIKGTAEGTTRVVPVNVNGVLNTIDGDVVQIDKIINTVPVIYVEKSGADAFTGSARTTGIQQVQLLKRTNGNSDEYYWSATALENDIDIYNPETPNYTQMPVANMELGYTTLATLHERRGENQTLAWDDCGTCVKDNKGQSWGRIVGSHLDLEGKNRFNLNGEQYVLQLGHDFIIQENAEKQTRNHTGGYISYGRSDIDFEDRYRTVDGKLSENKHTGSGKTDAFSLGLYNTYYDRNGSYLDVIGQVSHLRNTYNSAGLKQVKQNGFGALISAEIGRPYALTEHKENESGWLLEPQAQLTYQYLDLQSFNDDVRTVDQNDQHGLRGRVGVRVAHNREAKGLKTDTVYFTANVLHDFVNQSDIDIGPDRIKEKYNDTWGSLGVGMQLPVSQNGYFYADGRYEHTFASAKRETYKGTVGLKFTWK